MEGPSTPLSPQKETSAYDEETMQIERRGRRINRTTNILTAIVRVLTFLLQISVTATAAACLRQYYLTENYTNGSSQLWSPTTILWPTFLTLVVAIIILIFNGIVIFSYCCGRAAADRWVTYEGYFSNFANAVQTVVSTIAAGSTFGTSSNPNSLNYQTCVAPNADSNSAAFPQIGGICTMQLFMEYAMLVQILLNTVNALIKGTGFIATLNKAQLERHKSQAPKSAPTTVVDEESKGKE